MTHTTRTRITVLCVTIALLTGIASGAGLFLRGDGTFSPAVSVRGVQYQMATTGVYAYNGLQLVAEGIGWDLVTLVFAVPALLAVLPALSRDSLRARLFAVGLLGYLFYQYLMYAVSAVNPRLSPFEGDPCYPDLQSIPETPDAVFILTNPTVTEEIVRQCVDLGIGRVWMHCLMGTKPGLASNITSVSQDAVHMCRENGITVIPGACPNQFLEPDIGHRMMRLMFRTVGFHSVN